MAVSRVRVTSAPHCIFGSVMEVTSQVLSVTSLTKPSMPSTVVTRSSLLTPLELPLSSVSVSAQSPGLRAMTSALTVVVLRVLSGCPS